jgi:hypothetical protein
MHKQRLKLARAAILASVIAGPIGFPFASYGGPPSARNTGVELLGVAELPGTSIDASGFTDALSDGTPHNRLGGISAIDYTGANNLYFVLSDRGPHDGAVRYACRWHVVDLQTPSAEHRRTAARLKGTTLLRKPDGQSFIGLASAFEASLPDGDRRLDPEALRRGPAGSVFVSDEYGPRVLEFDDSGRERRTLCVPPRFLIQRPSANKADEIALNTTGRISNAGFEGLAISTDGRRLCALEQSPLLQDCRRSNGKKKREPASRGLKLSGLNVRLLELDLSTERTRELLYRLDRTQNKLSEILAVDPHQFLVIERDGEAGNAAICKRIVKIDIAEASDVSGIDALPHNKVPDGVQPVQKTTLIDLLDPQFGLVGKHFPEKLEGLAWGPDLPDGRKLLWISVDNDFKAVEPIQFYAFAVSKAALQ